MNKNEIYKTTDVEELNMTLALSDIFSAIVANGVTEDPLALICRSIVRYVNAVQFAFYCYSDDEVGQIPAVREDAKLYFPPPDVARKIVARLRRETRGGKIVFISPEKALSLLSPAQRKKWKCHACLAGDISVNGQVAAVLSIYMKPDYVVADRHRAWFSLFRDVASALLARRAMFLGMRAERDDAVKAHRELTLTLEAARQRMREHLSEIAQVKSNYQLGIISLRQAADTIEASANSLYAFSDVTKGRSTKEGVTFRDAALNAWVNAALPDPRIKAFVGIRGSNKSAMLLAVRSKIIDLGVTESRIVTIDFEDARFRRYKSADDVLAYLNAFPQTKEVNYLFLDEVSLLGWHADLLRRLQRDARWNVWFAASTFNPTLLSSNRKDTLNLLVYHTWTNPTMQRSVRELERNWCLIFMRDVVGDGDSPDSRAKEMLAEYYSDHLGEIKSFRDISREMSEFGRRLSTMSIRAYRQSLVDAHLLEFSNVYDPFEGRIVQEISGRAFFTDLELRLWRFGAAPEHDAARLALNRFYLELRRKYGAVYTPRGFDADFLTLQPNGKPLLWKLPDDPLYSLAKFRK